jgi:hypothetical protein
MIMRSFIKRAKKMWWMMLFPGNMKKKGPYFPSHSLSSTGFRLFDRNGCKTPKYPSSSKNFSRIPKLLQGTLGIMKRFAIKVTYI